MAVFDWRFWVTLAVLVVVVPLLAEVLFRWMRVVERFADKWFGRKW